MKILLSFLFMTATFLESSTDAKKTYQVAKISSDIIVTGKGDDPKWTSGITLTDFIYPWEKDTPSATSFKALHSDNWFYCLYQVQDNNINVYVKSNEKSEVIYSDRVEIFIRQNSAMSPYYGLELDPHGRVYDYEAELHRKFNPKWSWPAGQLIVKASMTKEGYIVEVAISKSSLTQLGLLKNKIIEAGIFRGDKPDPSGKDASKIKWISWVRPDSETPDFHIPSAFGELILKD